MSIIRLHKPNNQQLSFSVGGEFTVAQSGYEWIHHKTYSILRCFNEMVQAYRLIIEAKNSRSGFLDKKNPSFMLSQGAWFASFEVSTSTSLWHTVSCKSRMHSYFYFSVLRACLSWLLTRFSNLCNYQLQLKFTLCDFLRLSIPPSQQRNSTKHHRSIHIVLGSRYVRESYQAHSSYGLMIQQLRDLMDQRQANNSRGYSKNVRRQIDRRLSLADCDCTRLIAVELLKISCRKSDDIWAWMARNKYVIKNHRQTGQMMNESMENKLAGLTWQFIVLLHSECRIGCKYVR